MIKKYNQNNIFSKVFCLQRQIFRQLLMSCYLHSIFKADFTAAAAAAAASSEVEGMDGWIYVSLSNKCLAGVDSR